MPPNYVYRPPVQRARDAHKRSLYHLPPRTFGVATVATTGRVGYDNLCTNGNFEVDTIGWVPGGLSVLTQVADGNQKYGLGCMLVDDTGSGTGGAQFTRLYPTVAGEAWVATVWIRAKALADVGKMISVILSDASESSTTFVILSLTYQRVQVRAPVEGVWLSSNTSFTLRIRDDAVETVSYYVDGVIVEVVETANTSASPFEAVVGSLTKTPNKVLYSTLGYENMNTNDGFEAGIWPDTVGVDTASQDATQFKYGANSMKIAPTGAVSGRSLVLTGLTPGDDYRLSGWIFVSSYTAGVVNLDIIDGAVIDTSGIQLSAANGGWVYYSETFTYPGGGSGSVAIRFFGDGVPTFVAYLDGVVLEKSPAPITGALVRKPLKTLAGTVGTLTGAMSRKTLKALSGTMGALTGSNARTFIFSRTATLSGAVGAMTGVLTRQTNKVLSGTVGSLVGAVGTSFIPGGILYLQDVAGTMGAMTGVLTRRTNKALAGTFGSLTGALSRRTAKALPGAVGTMTGTVVKMTLKPLAGAVGTMTGALVRKPLKTLAGTVGTLTGALVRKPLKELAGTTGALTGTLAKRTNKALTGAAGTLSGTLSRKTFKVLAGAAGAMTGTVSAILTSGPVVFLVSLAGAMGAMTGSLNRHTTKSFTGTMGALTGTVAAGVLTIVGRAVTTVAPGLGRTLRSVSSVRGLKHETAVLPPVPPNPPRGNDPPVP